MDIEHDDEIVEEVDVILKPSRCDLYYVEYPMRPKNAGLSKFESIEGVRYKPLQSKFEYNVSIDPRCQNFERHVKGNAYTFESKLINNRTNYCIGKIHENRLLLTPITNCLQMRRSFREVEEKFKVGKKAAASTAGGKAGTTSKTTKSAQKMDEEEEAPGEIEPSQVKKSDEIKEIMNQIRNGQNLRQIERKLRTHRFQNELYDSEDFVNLKYNSTGSQESSQLLKALLDYPKVVEKKALPKHEYLKYLF